MFLQWGQQCITFSLFSLLTPLIVYSFSYNVSTHQIQTFHSPLSFVLLFFIFIQLSSFEDAHISLPLFCFSLFIVLELTPSLPMCASLYVLSFDNPLEPLSPIKSQLKCSLPVWEGFFEGQGLLCGWYVSHLEGGTQAL